uniref:Fibronectin-like protein n=1 Tax=Halisarca dujardinii TaxID=2583056 RepID=A0AA96MLU7_HALDU|nr:fibronectin-like protein [Halisarca dujardinii]
MDSCCSLQFVFLSAVVGAIFLGRGVEGTVQPPTGLTVNGYTRYVLYQFNTSPTEGCMHEVLAVAKREGIPNHGPTKLERLSPSVRTFQTLSGLYPGTDYTLQVTAVCPGNQSASVAANFTTLPEVPNGPPQRLMVSEATGTTATLSWEEPAPVHVNDKGGITAYILEANSSTAVSIRKKTYTLENLSPGSVYSVMVYAENSVGRSSQDDAAALTFTTSSEAPGAPVITGLLPRFYLVAISWDLPTPRTGAVTGYHMQYSIDGRLPYDRVFEGTTFTRYHIVHAPTDSVGLTHSVKVRAQTGGGYGPFCAPVTFVYRQIVVPTIRPLGCDKVSIAYTVHPLPACSHPTLKDRVTSVVFSYNVSTNATENVKLFQEVSLHGGEGQLVVSGLIPGNRYHFTAGLVATAGSSASLPMDMSRDMVVVLPGDGPCLETNECLAREFFTPSNSCSLVPSEHCDLTSQTTQTTTDTQPTATQTFSQTTTQASSQTTTEASSQTTTQTSSQTTTQTSSQTTTQTSSQTTTQASSQTTTQASSQTTTQASSQTTTEASSQTTTEASSQTTTEASSQTTTQASSQTTTRASSQTVASSQMPTTPASASPTTRVVPTPTSATTPPTDAIGNVGNQPSATPTSPIGPPIGPPTGSNQGNTSVSGPQESSSAKSCKETLVALVISVFFSAILQTLY